MNYSTSNKAFNRFCELAGAAEAGVHRVIRDRVASLMAQAGEDPCNEVLLAFRTQQFMHSLSILALLESTQLSIEPAEES